MNYARIAIIALFILLLLGLVTFIVMWANSADKAARWEGNYKNKDSIFTELNLSVKELRTDFRLLVDSVNAKTGLKLRPKQVTNITEIHNHYVTKNDTFVIKINPLAGKFPINFDNGCMAYAGVFDLNDSTYEHKMGQYNSDIQIVDYWDKPLMFSNSKRIHWRRFWKSKEYKREIINPCQDSVKIERISIEKR